MFREQDAVHMHGFIAPLAQEDPPLRVLATAYYTGSLVLWHMGGGPALLACDARVLETANTGIR